MSLIDNLRIPLKNNLPPVVKTLEKPPMRDLVKVCASGKLIPPAEVPWAYCVIADFINTRKPKPKRARIVFGIRIDTLYNQSLHTRDSPCNGWILVIKRRCKST